MVAVKTQLLDAIFSVLSNAKSYNSQYLNYIRNQETHKDSLDRNLMSVKAKFEKNKSNLQQHIDNTELSLKQLNSQLVSRPKAQQAQFIRQIEQQEKRLEDYKKSIAPETLQIQLEQLHTQFKNQEQQQRKQFEQFLTLKQVNQKQKVIKHLDICYDTDAINSENNLELILFFAANRSSSFQAVQNIGSLEQEKKQIKAQSKKGKNSNAGSLIERFLANWEVKSALREKKKIIQ